MYSYSLTGQKAEFPLWVAVWIESPGAGVILSSWLTGGADDDPAVQEQSIELLLAGRGNIYFVGYRCGEGGAADEQ